MHKPVLRNRSRTACAAFCLCLFSCLLGLAFCLVKSPQARSEAYLAASFSAMRDGRVEDAVLSAATAVHINPSDTKNWAALSAVLQQSGRDNLSRKARAIADRLQQNPAGAPPVYAMPAEFRLSLLAATGPLRP